MKGINNRLMKEKLKRYKNIKKRARTRMRSFGLLELKIWIEH
jgi:hypothetical protein